MGNCCASIRSGGGAQVFWGSRGRGGKTEREERGGKEEEEESSLALVPVSLSLSLLPLFIPRLGPPPASPSFPFLVFPPRNITKTRARCDTIRGARTKQQTGPYTTRARAARALNLDGAAGFPRLSLSRPPFVGRGAPGARGAALYFGAIRSAPMHRLSKSPVCGRRAARREREREDEEEEEASCSSSRGEKKRRRRRAASRALLSPRPGP